MNLQRWCKAKFLKATVEKYRVGLLAQLHGRSRVDKKFRPILRGGPGGRASLCICLNGVLFSLNTFVRALNSLLGTLRAFRSPTPLNVPLPQAARRRAGERIVPSIPSLPWSAKEKVLAVGLGRCYALFTPAKVVLFLGLFSPSQTSQFLNPFGMCKLHLRTCSVARRHERKNSFLRVWGELRQQLQRRGLGCMVNRQR